MKDAKIFNAGMFCFLFNKMLFYPHLNLENFDSFIAEYQQFNWSKFVKGKDKFN